MKKLVYKIILYYEACFISVSLIRGVTGILAVASCKLVLMIAGVRDSCVFEYFWNFYIYYNLTLYLHIQNINTCFQFVTFSTVSSITRKYWLMAALITGIIFGCK